MDAIEDARQAIARGQWALASSYLEVGVRTAAAMAGPTEWAAEDLPEAERSLSSSLLTGLRVLAQFPDYETVRGVAEVAERVGCTRTTTHRYLRTLLRAGQLERPGDSRRYRRARVLRPGAEPAPLAAWAALPVSPSCARSGAGRLGDHAHQFAPTLREEP